jgi:hypothetical protein
MKKYKKIILLSSLLLAICSGIFISCTKYGDGFISPYLQYTVNQFSFIRGRAATSFALTPDGSSQPFKVKWTHIYDASGKNADDLFRKKYPVTIWTAAYDPRVDLTYAAISAKRKTVEMEPLSVNESNGTIETNSGSLFLPLGSYTMDFEVSNSAGTQELKKGMTVVILDGKPIEIAPETGAFSLSLLVANTAGGAGSAGGTNNGVLFNGQNNPFVEYTIVRYADTPNIFIYKVMDKNGVVFNPKLGQIAKRPNGGLNPVPPFLQNLEDYAPDTFTPTDTAMILKYPLTPFPIVSLGNGYNMYYRIPSQFVKIDSTSAWSSNTAGNYYNGLTDSRYKGTYTLDKFDFAFRTPMRIQVPGAYYLRVKLLNATHR